MSIVEFSTYFGEWPYILIISIAVYLSFEYWRFPDLTIESSFTAGMVATYIAFTNEQLSPLVWLIILVSLPLIYAGCTWLLAFLNLPPLFAGLLVVLGAYTANFLLNNKQVSETGFIHDNGTKLADFLKPGSINTVEKFFLLYFVLAAFIILFLVFLSRSKLGMRLYLSRRTKDPLVPDALGIRQYSHLFLCMCTYNVIAYIGGIGFALSTDTSAVTFLGTITPGLACMFIVKAAKDYVSAPSKVNARIGHTGRISGAILRKSDSLWFILVVLLVLSGLIALARFKFRDLANAEIGLLNAFTAFGTFLVWAAITGFAKFLGKKVRNGAAGNF
jgi:ABC-type uncharacterized transport system permease subunit